MELSSNTGRILGLVAVLILLLIQLVPGHDTKLAARDARELSSYIVLAKSAVVARDFLT